MVFFTEALYAGKANPYPGCWFIATSIVEWNLPLGSWLMILGNGTIAGTSCWSLLLADGTPQCLYPHRPWWESGLVSSSLNSTAVGSRDFFQDRHRNVQVIYVMLQLGIESLSTCLCFSTLSSAFRSSQPVSS